MLGPHIHVGGGEGGSDGADQLRCAAVEEGAAPREEEGEFVGDAVGKRYLGEGLEDRDGSGVHEGLRTEVVGFGKLMPRGEFVEAAAIDPDDDVGVGEKGVGRFKEADIFVSGRKVSDGAVEAERGRYLEFAMVAVKGGAVVGYRGLLSRGLDYYPKNCGDNSEQRAGSG